MKRVAFAMRLMPGCADEYRRRHDAIWPNLKQLLWQTGISEYSIFLDSRTNTLFAVLRIDDALKLDRLPAHPVMQEWWRYMSDIMATHPDHSPETFPLEELFYLP